MSSTNTSTKVPSPPKAGGRGIKVKLSKVVVLKLSSQQLQGFPHVQPLTKPAATKSFKPTSPISPPAPPKESPPAPTTAAEVTAEIKSMPTPTPTSSDSLKTPRDDTKKKTTVTLKAGTKRPAGTEGAPKPRAKPGPKKRPRMDGIIGPDEVARPWTTPAPTAGHKLGPKANQGAINAGLRALDRTGKPCRKWEKKVFRVKSFTGVTWALPSWVAPRKDKLEPTGENGPHGTPTSTSDIPNNQSSSNVGSDNTPNGVTDANHMVSSPAAGIMTPA